MVKLPQWNKFRMIIINPYIELMLIWNKALAILIILLLHKLPLLVEYNSIRYNVIVID